MCGDYVFGGDFDNPNAGYNRYKLWTRSKSYEGFYCVVLLISVIVALVILFKRDVLENCYEPSLVMVILAHIIKPFVIALSIKFIPKKPVCCAVLRLSPMIFMDLPYAIFVMIFSWYPLVICVLDENIEIDGLVLVILLLCLIIHLIFPLMAIVRFIEVIVFERRLDRIRKERRERQAQQQQQERNDNENNDNHVDIDINNTEEEVDDEDIDNDESKDQFSESPENTFIYGTVSSKKGNGLNDHKTSLSNIFAASTRFISSGVVNINDEEEICIICYDVFERGKLCARLTCGHIFHRNCAKEWLEESGTCPLCRMGVTKQ